MVQATGCPSAHRSWGSQPLSSPTLPKAPQAAQGQGAPSGWAPPTQLTLPWAVPLGPSKALNAPKEGEAGKRNKEHGKSGTESRTETCTHRCSTCRELNGGSGGGGRKEEGGDSRCALPQSPGPSLGAQQQAALNRVLSCWAQFSTIPAMAQGLQVTEVAQVASLWPPLTFSSL